MRRFRQFSLLIALTLLTACGAPAPLSELRVEPALITPNGDGATDLTQISYRLAADSAVSIFLQDTAGKRYVLRDNAPRSARPAPYELLFNGIDASGRMVPNGEYTLHVEAGGTTLSAPLRVEQADAEPPRILEFSTRSGGDASQIAFTPNRDAIDDHVYVNVSTSKAARIAVYVLGADGFRQDVPREQLGRDDFTREFLEPGRYFYDYDGGINKGADPPPDGRYTLVAEIEDRIGQRDVQTRTLIITDSGKPRAEIVTQPNGQGVMWEGVGNTPELTVKLGDTIRFTTTVRNVGMSPIRTAGPFDPESCYTLDQNRYSKGFQEEPGIWRVGLDFETNAGEDHPFRWGMGTLADLDVVERDGAKLYYLAPNKQVIVRGCITFNRVPVRNPFRLWGALIQEEVEVFNRDVSPILVTVVEP
jgi:hypothetical protein